MTTHVFRLGQAVRYGGNRYTVAAVNDVLDTAKEGPIPYRLLIEDAQGDQIALLAAADLDAVTPE